MPKPKARVTPIAMISPVAATSTDAAVRPMMSYKRIQRLRINWFVVGSVFGIGLSFFMNLLVTAFIMPQYQALTGHKGDITFANEQQPEKPTRLASLAAAIAHPAEKAAPTQENAANAEPAKEAPVQQAALTYPRNLTLKVEDGDTLLDMLLANHVPGNEAHNVVAALKSEFNPRSLKVGQDISITLARHESLENAAAVKELAIKLPNLSTVELHAAGDSFNVAAVKAELKDHAYRGFGKVRTSLFQAGADGGIPSGAMGEVVQAFSYDVDFQRDIHPGDTIEVLLDRKQTAEGDVGGYGNVRYAALTLRGKKHEIFRFKDAYNNVAWYDASGKSIKKSLLATPLNAARITSGFGMRNHPILGYSKMHKGVDFGATQGTPIMAAGDATVEQKGWMNGYGNFVLLKHNGTYETAYGHMSRFANINVGGRVKQGQVIGYVGMTGAATGPHLHYEVREKGKQVNPTQKQFNVSPGLTGTQLAKFNSAKKSVSAELASLSRPTTAAKLASR